MARMRLLFLFTSLAGVLQLFATTHSGWTMPSLREAAGGCQRDIGWRQFRYAEDRSGHNPCERILGPGNVGDLQQEWSAPISPVRTSPIVSGGVVYVLEAPAGTQDNPSSLWAVEADTGAALWTYPISGYSSPAAAYGMVFVANAVPREGGFPETYGFDADTGEVVWSTPMAGGWSSPAVSNGVVYVGSYGDRVHALDAFTGGTLWTAETGGDIDSSPAVADGFVYVGSNDHKVYAFDATTGARVWTASTGGEVFSSPAVFRGVVYVGSRNGTFFALDAQTGAPLWTRHLASGIESSPAVTHDAVYVGTFRTVGLGPDVFALDPDDGLILWSVDAPNRVRSSPAVANGVVYFNMKDRFLLGYDALTGDILWAGEDGNGERSSPAITGGMVFGGTTNEMGLLAYGLP